MKVNLDAVPNAVSGKAAAPECICIIMSVPYRSKGYKRFYKILDPLIGPECIREPHNFKLSCTLLIAIRTHVRVVAKIAI